MRGPIAHCLDWPNRIESTRKRLDLAALPPLTFTQPDPARFPALTIARAALDRGTRATNIMSAANEVAVAAFLAGKIGFLQITDVVEDTLARAGADLSAHPLQGIEEAIALDRHGRRIAAELIG
jgi:1-deoxy-D-xylulose-5-phosphate reductoisomerase